MDEIIKLLKQDIADCRVNDGNCVDNTDDVTYALATLETLIEAINYTLCCTELKSKINPNFKFKNEDFKYSEFIKGVGKEYNYVLGNKHYFVNGELVKIL